MTSNFLLQQFPNRASLLWVYSEHCFSASAAGEILRDEICFRHFFAIILLLAGRQFGFAQGFENLDFEAANVSAYGAGSIPATNGIPGWTAYVNGSQVSQILYNTINLDEPAVTIQGTNSSSLTPIQGNVSVLLQRGSVYAIGSSSAIGQTGQIPITAQSITFWGGDNYVSFNGQPLSIVLLAGCGKSPCNLKSLKIGS